LRLRIPSWSKSTAVRLNRSSPTNVVAGRYLEMKRRWKAGDRVTLDFDLQLRAVPGEHEAAGKVSIYRGPLLLAFDQKLNDFDEEEVPALDLQKLGEAKEVSVRKKEEKDTLLPWIVLEAPAQGGRHVRLCDFASAGAAGTRYRSWLPVMGTSTTTNQASTREKERK